MEKKKFKIGIVGAGRIGTAIYSLLVGKASGYNISIADVDSHHKHWAINESHFFEIETPISYGTQFHEFVENKTLIIKRLRINHSCINICKDLEFRRTTYIVAITRRAV